jgi:hypothetical protein
VFVDFRVLDTAERLIRRGHAATASTWTLTDRLGSFVRVGRLSVGDRVGRPERRRDEHERQTTRTEETDGTDESDTYRL